MRGPDGHEPRRRFGAHARGLPHELQFGERRHPVGRPRPDLRPAGLHVHGDVVQPAIGRGRPERQQVVGVGVARHRLEGRLQIAGRRDERAARPGRQLPQDGQPPGPGVRRRRRIGIDGIDRQVEAARDPDDGGEPREPHARLPRRRLESAAHQHDRLASVRQPRHAGRQPLERRQHHLGAGGLDGGRRAPHEVALERVARRVVAEPSGEGVDRVVDGRPIPRDRQGRRLIERPHDHDRVVGPQRRVDEAVEGVARPQGARARIDVIVVEQQAEHATRAGGLAGRAGRHGRRHRHRRRRVEGDLLDRARRAALGDGEVGRPQMADRIAALVGDDDVEMNGGEAAGVEIVSRRLGGGCRRPCGRRRHRGPRVRHRGRPGDEAQRRDDRVKESTLHGGTSVRRWRPPPSSWR